VLGISSTKLDDVSKALINACIMAIIVFATETLPIQFALDDAFIRLFSRERESMAEPERVEETKVSLNESFLSAGRSHNATSNASFEGKIQAEETKGNTSKTPPTDPLQLNIQPNISVVSTAASRRRMSYKEYSSMNMSIESIRKRIKGQIITSEQFKLLSAFSTVPHKLGKIYDKTKSHRIK